jgi:hypothetical protein
VNAEVVLPVDHRYLGISDHLQASALTALSTEANRCHPRAELTGIYRRPASDRLPGVAAPLISNDLQTTKAFRRTPSRTLGIARAELTGICRRSSSRTLLRSGPQSAITKVHAQKLPPPCSALFLDCCSIVFLCPRIASHRPAASPLSFEAPISCDYRVIARDPLLDCIFIVFPLLFTME